MQHCTFFLIKKKREQAAGNSIKCRHRYCVNFKYSYIKSKHNTQFVSEEMSWKNKNGKIWDIRISTNAMVSAKMVSSPTSCACKENKLPCVQECI